MGLDATAFSAKLQIIDGNPFVALPQDVLSEVFRDAGRSKSPIPILGTINGRPYQQTLVKFRGAWRLYVNMQMLDDSPRRIGESIEATVCFDPSDRRITPHPKLAAMLESNPTAKDVFDDLAPSRQHEIVRPRRTSTPARSGSTWSQPASQPLEHAPDPHGPTLAASGCRYGQRSVVLYGACGARR